MRKLLLAALLTIAGALTGHAQISGVGQIGCSGTPVTGTGWTSATSINTTQSLVTNSSLIALLVQLDQTSTISGGAVTFQYSGDGSAGTYISIPVAQVLNPDTGAQLTNPYTLVASTNQQFLLLLNGKTNVQLKLTTVITGSATVTPFTASVCVLPSWPTSLDSLGNQLSRVNSWLGSTAPTVGQKTGANSVPVVPASDFIDTATGNKADDGAAAGTDRLASLPAIEQAQLPAAGTAGRNKALRTDLNGTLYTGVMPVNITTYTTNKIGLASVASATDIAVLPGNATNTVIVTRVQVSCTQTTAGIIDLQLIKRSTADTGGTSASMTIVPLDSGNGAAVSAPLTYTANPTTGTAVGNVDSVKLGCMAAATASPADIYVWKPGMGQSIVLRGTAQQLAVNLNGVTVTGSSFDVTFSWIETTGL